MVARLLDAANRGVFRTANGVTVAIVSSNVSSSPHETETGLMWTFGPRWWKHGTLAPTCAKLVSSWLGWCAYVFCGNDMSAFMVVANNVDLWLT